MIRKHRPLWVNLGLAAVVPAARFDLRSGSVKKLGWAWLMILLVFPVSSVGDHKKPATQKEESFMLGRVLGAIEDTGGGYTREALNKFSSINKDLEKREYSPRTRWMAHHWYGKALLDSGDRKAALSMLQVAEREATSLTGKEKEQTAELLRQARAKLFEK